MGMRIQVFCVPLYSKRPAIGEGTNFCHGHSNPKIDIKKIN